MRRLCILGGCGGIGRSLVVAGLAAGYDLAVMDRLRAAFDPDGICNPGKVLPTPRLCGEVPGPYRRHPLEVAGLAERF